MWKMWKSETGNEKEISVCGRARACVRKRGRKMMQGFFSPLARLIRWQDADRETACLWLSRRCHSKSSKGCVQAPGNLTVTAHISAPTTAPRWSSSNNLCQLCRSNLTAMKLLWLRWYPLCALLNTLMGQPPPSQKKKSQIQFYLFIASIIKKSKSSTCVHSIYLW